jgi:MFS family permease
MFLLVVFIPEPEKKIKDEKAGAFFRELVYGFRYVWDRPSLFSLQLVFFFGNFFSSVGFTLFAPMILASTSGDSTVLGAVQSAGAVGGLVGGLIMTAWGGPKKKINGVLLGWILFGVFGLSMLGLGSAVPIWLGASFLGMLVNPMLNGSNQAIWQAKVSPEVQGRVFSVRRLIAQVTAPLSMAVAGPLADNVFEPAMKNPDHRLGGLLGPIFGNDPGSGMSLLVFLSGLLVISVGMIACQIRQVRDVETLVPDHDQV